VKLVYLAAPLSPVGDESRGLNIHRAKVIYEVLCLKHTDCVFLMPWLLNSEIFDETPENRAIGMARNHAVISVCDELWLVGPRVSPGMMAEAAHAERNGVVVKKHVVGGE
jgi:hypothetical protein